MWALLRTAVVWVFGDDLVKWALYLLVGLFVVTYLEAMGVTHAILGQPGGQYWLAGMAGAGAQQATAQQPAPPVDQPLPQPVPQPQQAVPPLPKPAVPQLLQPAPQVAPDRVTALIGQAMTWLGTPYAWGGCSRKGVDCSCFMQNIFATIGVRLDRTTTQQISQAIPIRADQAAAGDLVFYDNTCTGCGPNPTHVGLYLGDGKMIDAGSPVGVRGILTRNNPRFGRVLR